MLRTITSITTAWTLKLLLQTLPLLAFIAAFALLGDVLIAAMIAGTFAFAQFVLTLSAQRGISMVSLASLAVVVFLLMLSLSGEDATAASLLSSGDLFSNALCETTQCACRHPLTFI